MGAQSPRSLFTVKTWNACKHLDEPQTWFKTDLVNKQKESCPSGVSWKRIFDSAEDRRGLECPPASLPSS